MVTRILTVGIVCLMALCVARAGVIHGTVRDAAGNPVAGASIFIEASARGAVSGVDGAYRIEGMPDGTHVLLISMMGFRGEKRSVTIGPPSHIAQADFRLSEVAVEIGEVVVTANKDEQRVNTLPAAISAISAERLGDHGVRDRTDLMALAPNALVAETGSHMTNLINVRGMFPSTFFTATTLFYIDGVPIYGYGLNPMFLNDLERIEVLRGPQGTLYGRTALAGVVHIVTAKPNNVPRLVFETGYGDYGDARISLAASTPIVEGLYGRASAFYSSRDGWHTNTFLKKNAGDITGYGGSAQLRWFPSSIFSAEATLSLEHLNESVWPMASDPATALAHPFEFQTDIDSRIKKLNLLSALTLRADLGVAHIVSTSTYQGISGYDWLYDADFSPYDVLGFHATSPYSIFTQELRLESAAAESALRWRLGAFFSTDKNDNNYSALLGKVWAQSMGVPIYPLESHTEGVGRAKNYALFGQCTYTPFDRFTVTAGVRVEREELSSESTTQYLYQGKPAPLPFPPFNQVEKLTQNRNFSFVSPSFSVAYTPNESGLLYASVARGFHGGGFNSGANKKIPSYGPENTWNYELGYKGRFLDDHLSLNAAAFYILWYDQQLLVIGDLSSPLQTITNAGRTTSKGLELEVAAVPMDGLTFTLAAGLLEAQLDEYTFTDKKNGRDTVYNYAGNELPFAPRLSSLASVKYEMPVEALGISGRCYAVFNYQFIDPYYLSHMNLFRSSARHLLSARLGVATRNVEIYAWGKNLADLRFVMGVYEYRGGQNAYLGAPRTVGLGMRLTF